MKKILIPLLALAFIASISSCAKCVTCRKDSQWEKICDKNNDKKDVDNAIAFYENLGWTCKASMGSY